MEDVETHNEYVHDIEMTKVKHSTLVVIIIVAASIFYGLLSIMLGGVDDPTSQVYMILSGALGYSIKGNSDKKQDKKIAELETTIKKLEEGGE